MGAATCRAGSANRATSRNGTLYEEVPEAERPYFGTRKWEANLFLRLAGSLRAVPIRDEEIPYHGDIEFCCTNIGAVGPEGFATVDDSPVDTREYVARFTHGRVEWIRGGCQPEEGVQRPRAELWRLWKERTRGGSSLGAALSHPGGSGAMIEYKG